MLSARMCLPFTRLLLAKTWLAWALLVATLLLCLVLGYALPKDGLQLGGYPLLMVIVFLFGALSMVEPQQESASGFPSYLHQLPVSDMDLVLWPMIISAVFLAAAGGAISLLVVGKFGAFSETWWLMPYLAANGVIFQAASWVPMRRPELRATMNLVAVGSIVLGPMALGFGLIHAPLLALIYFTLMIGAMALTARGVARARHGLAQVGSPDGPGYQIPELPVFRNRVASQQWLEDKRNGLVMRVLTVMFLVLFGALSLLTMLSQPDAFSLRGQQMAFPTLALTSLALIVPGYFSYGGCCGSERDNLAKDRSLLPFLALRPLTDVQIIEAKIRMAMNVSVRMAALQIVVAFAMLCIPVAVNGHRQPTIVAMVHALNGKEWLSILGIFVLMVLNGIKGAASGIWCALGRLPVAAIIVLGFVPFALIVGVSERLFTHREEIPKFMALLPWFVWIYSGIKLASLILATIKLRQMRLVDDSLIVKWFAGCLVAGVILFAIGCLVIPSNVYGRGPVAAQVFCFLPLVRIVIAPIFVHRGRHQ